MTIANVLYRKVLKKVLLKWRGSLPASGYGLDAGTDSGGAGLSGELKKLFPDEQ